MCGCGGREMRGDGWSIGGEGGSERVREEREEGRGKKRWERE